MPGSVVLPPVNPYFQCAKVGASVKLHLGINYEALARSAVNSGQRDRSPAKRRKRLKFPAAHSQQLPIPLLILLGQCLVGRVLPGEVVCGRNRSPEDSVNNPAKLGADRVVQKQRETLGRA